MPKQIETDSGLGDAEVTQPAEPDSPPLPDVYATARGLLRFVGTWAGDDLEELVEMVSRTRSEAAFWG